MIFCGKWGFRTKTVDTGPVIVAYYLPEGPTLRLYGPTGLYLDYPLPRLGSPPTNEEIFPLLQAAHPNLGGPNLGGPNLGEIPYFIVYAAPVFRMMLEHVAEEADFSLLGVHACDLSGVDLSKVRFNNGDFRGAKLTGTKFSGAYLANSRFDGKGLAGLDCSGADFSGNTLNGLDLTGTDFSKANLTGTTFTGCTLTRTKFDGAVLNATVLNGATLTNVTFKEAIGAAPQFAGSTLTNCSLDGAQLAGANFSGATLTGGSGTSAILPLANFSGATLDGVNFEKALLAGASFCHEKAATFRNGVDLGEADLQAADFTGVSLEAGRVKPKPPKFGTAPETRTKFVKATLYDGFLGTKWSYADFTDATIVLAEDFDTDKLEAMFSILPRVNFAGRGLYKANFTSAILHGANFARCDLQSADFTNAVLCAAAASGAAADFSRARMTLAIFTGADLSGVTFDGSDLQQATFTNSLLLLTSFANAFVAQVDFMGIQDRRMAGVNFTGACLVGAKFSQTVMTRYPPTSPNFSQACLLGADFTGASLGDATFTGAKLSTATGKIDAKVAPRRESGSVRTISLDYDATKLPTSITTSQTRCPDGNYGPCSAERLKTEPVPTEWVQPRPQTMD